jgi:hypothetical protein
MIISGMANLQVLGYGRAAEDDSPHGSVDSCAMLVSVVASVTMSHSSVT